jgi:hypothetical protein
VLGAVGASDPDATIVHFSSIQLLFFSPLELAHVRPAQRNEDCAAIPADALGWESTCTWTGKHVHWCGTFPCLLGLHQLLIFEFHLARHTLPHTTAGHWDGIPIPSTEPTIGCVGGGLGGAQGL